MIQYCSARLVAAEQRRPSRYYDIQHKYLHARAPPNVVYSGPHTRCAWLLVLVLVLQHDLVSAAVAEDLLDDLREEGGIR